MPEGKRWKKKWYTAYTKNPSMSLEIFQESSSNRQDPGLWKELWSDSIKESAKFVSDKLDKAVVFDSRAKIHNYALSLVPNEGLLVEAGVYKADSINTFAKALKSNNDERLIFGFDSFEGLSEDWNGHSVTKGFFDLQGVLPTVEDNVVLIKGWIDETLPKWLSQTEGEISFLHIDTDTYSPCKIILESCKSRLRKGCVVLFDELLCYPGWKFGELKALLEVFEENEYDWRAFAGHWACMTIK